MKEKFPKTYQEEAKNSEAESKGRKVEELNEPKERRILNCLHTRACLYSEFQTENFNAYNL